MNIFNAKKNVAKPLNTNKLTLFRIIMFLLSSVLLGLFFVSNCSAIGDPANPTETQLNQTEKQMMDMTKMGNNMDLMGCMQSSRYGRDPKFDNMDKDDGCMCNRDCSRYPKPRLCYWKFFVEQYSSMGPACRNCSIGNIKHCYHEQCIVGDGREKTVFVVNRMAPGPSIIVCINDLIVIDVMNLMSSQSVTIHWHGMMQETTPWMDGAPYLTQCPIPPHGQFRYKFPALTAGTLWYHSHVGNLKRDGLNGALIVKVPRKQEPKFCDYDYDLPSHIINIDDWQQYLFDYQFPGYHLNASHSPIKAESYTINGFGSFNDGTTKTNTPHAQFHVKCGKKYRFRVISTSSINCLCQFAIEGHNLTVIALDGGFIQPVVMKTITMGSGMRTDFILNADRCGKNSKAGKCSFYMTVRVLDFCKNQTIPQTAYLVYDNCSPKPTNKINMASVFEGGQNLDYIEGGCDRSDVTCSDKCRSHEKPSDPRLAYGGKCEHRLFIRAKNHLFTFKDLFENPMEPAQFYYQPGGESGPDGRILTDVLNNISSMMPPVPLLTQEFPIPKKMLCSNDCKSNFCRCINIQRYPLNACVEFVIVDEMKSNHPFHIHGHKWRVLKMGTEAELKKPNYWLNIDKTPYPPERDTTISPGNGYIVVRFIANNPGYWFFHCHFQNHLAGGMAFTVQVGERHQFPKIPKDFPKCEPYLPVAYEAPRYSRQCSSKMVEAEKYGGADDCSGSKEGECKASCQVGANITSRSDMEADPHGV